MVEGRWGEVGDGWNDGCGCCWSFCVGEAGVDKRRGGGTLDVVPGCAGSGAGALRTVGVGEDDDEDEGGRSAIETGEGVKTRVKEEVQAGSWG